VVKRLSEIRKDYLANRWVILAPERAKRPSDFAVSRVKAKPRVCSFCPGRENLTPPAKLLYVLRRSKIMKLSDRGGRRRSDWRVRCIPNLYPALSLPIYRSATKTQGRFPYIGERPTGVHEIIIESPRHDDHPHRASESQIELWLRAAIDRMGELGHLESTQSMALFRNHGREAGASVTHAHSQIITTPVIPARIEQEQQTMKKFHDESGCCALCQIRSTESRSDRKILSTEAFSVFAPWASIFPFEFWIVPKRHSNSPLDLSRDEARDLAKTIRLSFGALANILADPPYNSIFHLATSRFSDGVFHWHIEVYPKVSVHAGFELGTGMYVNTLKPEAAAQVLASAVKNEASNRN